MKTFYVRFVDWDAWGISLEAKDEDDAIEKATERWNNMGTDDAGFSFKNGGTEEWEATAIKAEKNSDV